MKKKRALTPAEIRRLRVLYRQALVGEALELDAQIADAKTQRALDRLAPKAEALRREWDRINKLLQE